MQAWAQSAAASRALLEVDLPGEEMALAPVRARLVLVPLANSAMSLQAPELGQEQSERKAMLIPQHLRRHHHRNQLTTREQGRMLLCCAYWLQMDLVAQSKWLGSDSGDTCMHCRSGSRADLPAQMHRRAERLTLLDS